MTISEKYANDTFRDAVQSQSLEIFETNQRTEERAKQFRARDIAVAFAIYGHSSLPSILGVIERPLAVE